MSETWTEFIFIFNDLWRADNGAEAARAKGWDVQILPADGGGRHFQARLRVGRPMDIDEQDRRSEDLRRMLAAHRGRYQGGSTFHRSV